MSNPNEFDMTEMDEEMDLENLFDDDDDMEDDDFEFADDDDE